MGDRRTVDEIAEFAVAADSSWFRGCAPATMKRNVLDSLACAGGALDGPAPRAIRAQIEADGGTGAATLVGGGRATESQAALVNSVLVRYVDHLDTYLTPGGPAHPADDLGGVPAAAERAGASGVVHTFHRLAEPHADARLRSAVISLVDTLDQHPVSELTALLGAMCTSAERDRTDDPV